MSHTIIGANISNAYATPRRPEGTPPDKPFPKLKGQGVLINMLGKRFGRLTVIAREQNTPQGQARWLCKCDCGGTTIAHGKTLRKGLSQSCGCLNKEICADQCRFRIKHGHARDVERTPTYRSYAAMLTRCYNPKSDKFKNWGARGIQVCDRWTDGRFGFLNFLSDMGERPVGTTLHRIDNDGNYMPSNCKWATWAEQVSNRRKPLCQSKQ